MATIDLQDLFGAFPATLGELVVDTDDHGFVIYGPNSDSSSSKIEPVLSTIREWLRYDELGRYRPMYSARTMRGGWQTSCPNSEELIDVLDAIYPLAVTHLAMQQAKALRPTVLSAVLERQSGRYKVATDVANDSAQLAVDTLCGRCVRTPVWNGESVAEASVPCPEACSVMVALCREITHWQLEPQPICESDETIDFADFEKPGNEIREQILKMRSDEGSSDR